MQSQKKQAAQIILAQDEERNRLARDLHDDLGNTVTMMQLLLSRMKMNVQNEDAIREMQQLVKKASEDVRNISHQLMPVDLHEKGLFEAMQQTTAFLNQHSGIAFRFLSKGEDSKIPYELQLVIYRIFNELTTNILKHSNAGRADLQCIIYEGYILVSAEDDGRGAAIDNSKDGIGLNNIRNRVAYLNGKMNIEVSEGTTIMIEIPLINKR